MISRSHRQMLANHIDRWPDWQGTNWFRDRPDLSAQHVLDMLRARPWVIRHASPEIYLAWLRGQLTQAGVLAAIRDLAGGTDTHAISEWTAALSRSPFTVAYYVRNGIHVSRSGVL